MLSIATERLSPWWRVGLWRRTRRRTSVIYLQKSFPASQETAWSVHVLKVKPWWFIPHEGYTMFALEVGVAKFICNYWRIVACSIRRVLGASCRFEENELILAWQMGHELHVTDSSSTGHERVTYIVMSMTYQQESSTGHKHVTYLVTSMTGHGDRSRTHQVRGTNVSRTKLCTNVRN